MVKLSSSQASNRIVDRCVQISGGPRLLAFPAAKPAGAV